jgi:hypothetical protein
MKAASLIRVGTRADEVLKMRGRGAEFTVARPALVGTEWDTGGRYVIAWHYDDCDVILHYRNNCYRVREVHDVVNSNAG